MNKHEHGSFDVDRRGIIDMRCEEELCLTTEGMWIYCRKNQDAGDGSTVKQIRGYQERATDDDQKQRFNTG